MTDLPTSGEASTYSDWFIGKRTSNGDIYTHEGWTAALLPRSRWYVVPMGTRVEVGYQGRRAVLKINDRGAGRRDGQETRVLDLSRAAYAHLLGVEQSRVTDRNAGVIQLSSIRVVDRSTALGPVT